ncbi:HD domain-containing protein [Polynucleobacter sp. AP-Elch-400A-B2]|uniref:HD domain-containing phosphohydrolase n=1 Tax=Polynucleobacter sp. AP-Elch-400A-B2 TaxID=2576930 RepID=UPI001BFCFAB7|nr:HD domain-containing phosphohydrolase [Polynucleobacter sp. AP-Elch-400A-B2]QWE25514.1 HD domain-containing protein [Polynucleobacter sp. AP-Elch-400A-B2]
MHRFNLTKQELSVLSYLNEGLTVKALAKNLDISTHTVNGHMKSIYFKMNVKSRGEAQHKFNAYKAVIANEELSFQNKEKAKRAEELVIANSEKADRAAELVIANEELSFQNKEKAKRAQELVIANSEKANRAAELVIANEELSFQNKEKAKRAEELVNANVAKTYRAAELVIANDEKTYRAAELVIANEELSFQNKEKAKRAHELVIANSEKADRAAELVIANSEKADRAAELVIAIGEKADRAAELVIAISEKADRAAELVIAISEKADRAAELEAMLLGKNSTNKKVYQTESQFLSCLNALAMARDNETENHILRTQHYVKTIALRLKEMGNYKIELSDEMIKLLFEAASLHDIGKIGIPDSILHKPGRLNDEEWQVMKTHASIGQAILASAELKTKGGSGVIAVAIKIAAEHHEKWDGSGYPSGLKGEEISLPARIMALADFYDGLMSKPIYKSGLSHEDAESEIASQRGAHFDPLVVDAFMLEKAGFLAIHSKYKDH